MKFRDISRSFEDYGLGPISFVILDNNRRDKNQHKTIGNTFLFIFSSQLNQNAIPSILARMVQRVGKHVTHTNVSVEMDLEGITVKVMDIDVYEITPMTLNLQLKY
jgi:hypothetical protein